MLVPTGKQETSDLGRTPTVLSCRQSGRVEVLEKGGICVDYRGSGD